MKKIAILVVLVFLIGCDQKPTQTPAPEAPAAPEVAEVEVKEPVEKPTSADSGEEKKAQLPGDMKAGETKLYGAKFALTETISLASALEKAATNEGPYKVEAKIEKVCKKKGCWFTLTAEGVEKPVRVRMKDYGFFVPRNTESAAAVLEGTLIAREMPTKEAKHYAEDEGKSPEEVAKVEGGKTYEFTATAVEVSMPQS